MLDSLQRLKTVARVSYGLGEPPKLSEATDAIPILRATNIFRGRVSPDGLIFAALDDLPLDRAPLLREGEIIVVRSGAYTGDSALITSEWAGCAPGYDLRVTPFGADPRFLAYLFLSVFGKDQIDLARERAAQPHLNAEDLSELRLWVPPLRLQRAIADYLDVETARIDALVEKKRRMVELIEERRMSVMTDGVRGQLTSTRVESSGLRWLRTRGMGWREAKLTLVARLGTGHTPSREHPEWWLDCNIPWITTGEVTQMRSDRIEFITETREYISTLGIENSSAELHPSGTVVLCRTASAGYSAIMGTDMATSQDFATWTCGPLLRPRFLLLCLRAMRQDLLGRLAMGSTHKTIYMPDIEGLRIPLPDVTEQDAIVELVWNKLRDLDRASDLLAQQVGLLVEHRQTIITAAVTGALDIPGVAA